MDRTSMFKNKGKDQDVSIESCKFSSRFSLLDHVLLQIGDAKKTNGGHRWAAQK